MRRYFIDLLTVLSNRCSLCPTARHLAIYLLDLFMDRYDITVKQLYVTSFACLLLASSWLLFTVAFLPFSEQMVVLLAYLHTENCM